jgi:hypothetical protein
MQEMFLHAKYCIFIFSHNINALVFGTTFAIALMRSSSQTLSRRLGRLDAIRFITGQIQESSMQSMLPPSGPRSSRLRRWLFAAASVAALATPQLAAAAADRFVPVLR